MEDSCATNKTIFGQIELQKWTFFLVVDSLEEFDGLLSTISLFKFYNRKLIISIGLLVKIWGLSKTIQNGFH